MLVLPARKAERNSVPVSLVSWDAVGVIFGDQVSSARTTAPSDWIAPARRGPLGTVGALVPNGYSSLLRVHAPPPSDDWWSRYCYLYEVVAAIGARHTTRPDLAWFAVWEGHGFDTSTSRMAWRDPPANTAERRARDAQRAQLRDESRRRNAAVRAELDMVPKFALPDRTYHLMKGPVASVLGLRDPSAGHWRNPDLFWPDDRRWFVATDVDFWSLYVGGDDDFIAELEACVATPTEHITLDRQLETEV